MINLKRIAMFLAAIAAEIFLLLPHGQPARAQQSQSSPPAPHQDHGNMPGMDMNDSMSGEHMDMGPHMFMTALRAENPADDQRADALVITLREAIARYKDYKVALADGFQIFHPEVPQPHYHFTNYRYAFEAAFEFNPAHPTSLLYKKTSDGYELEGAMFTAPNRATEDDLNARVPLSVARWHKHVNICLPPKGARLQQVNLKEFGFRSAISTEDACREAGGRWHAQIFNWMVHVYPYETDPAKIWAH